MAPDVHCIEIPLRVVTCPQPEVCRCSALLPLLPSLHCFQYRWIDDPARSTWDLVGIYYGYSSHFSCPLCKKVGDTRLAQPPRIPGDGVLHSVHRQLTSSKKDNCPIGGTSGSCGRFAQPALPPGSHAQVYAGQGHKWRLMYALYSHPDWRQLAAQYRAVMVADENVALSTSAVNKWVRWDGAGLGWMEGCTADAVRHYIWV